MLLLTLVGLVAAALREYDGQRKKDILESIR